MLNSRNNNVALLKSQSAGLLTMESSMTRLVNQLTLSHRFGFLLAIAFSFCSVSMFSKYVVAQPLPALEEEDDVVMLK